MQEKGHSERGKQARELERLKGLLPLDSFSNCFERSRKEKDLTLGLILSGEVNMAVGWLLQHSNISR